MRKHTAETPVLALPLPAHLLPLSQTSLSQTSTYLMDASDTAGTGGDSWDIDITMGNHLFLDQLPLELLPVEHLSQTHQLPSSVPLSVPIPRDASDARHRGQQKEKEQEQDEEGEKLGPMKEMMYRIASMQPVDIDPASIKKPKRRNVHISDDPQSTAARHRRERISERIRILQRLVPGGTKLDTASMLEEAIRYVKYLKRQVQILQSTEPSTPQNIAPPADWVCTGAAAASTSIGVGSAAPVSSGFVLPLDGSYDHLHLPFASRGQ